jgi:hypothetical protein
MSAQPPIKIVASATDKTFAFMINILYVVKSGKYLCIAIKSQGDYTGIIRRPALGEPRRLFATSSFDLVL